MVLGICKCPPDLDGLSLHPWLIAAEALPDRDSLRTRIWPTPRPVRVQPLKVVQLASNRLRIPK
jgi:hypothetical protein